MARSKTTVYSWHTMQNLLMLLCSAKGQSPGFRSADDGITVIRTLSICINELSVKNKMKTYTTWSHTWGLGWAAPHYVLAYLAR